MWERAWYCSCRKTTRLPVTSSWVVFTTVLNPGWVGARKALSGCDTHGWMMSEERLDGAGTTFQNIVYLRNKTSVLSTGNWQVGGDHKRGGHCDFRISSLKYMSLTSDLYWRQMFPRGAWYPAFCFLTQRLGPHVCLRDSCQGGCRSVTSSQEWSGKTSSDYWLPNG